MCAMCLGSVATGRWMSAQRPLNVCGKSAASLSSGGIRVPCGRNVVKSCVEARRTSGRVACVDNHVLVAAQCDPGVLDAEPLRLGVEIRNDPPVRVDRPLAHAVLAAGGAKMREARAILHPNDEKRLPL